MSAGDTPEAAAVCEHFYASHCYRGMSIRLCMTCGDPDWDDLAEQLDRKPARDPLARAETAEAKLAAITAYCRDDCEVVNEGMRLVAIVRASDILAIIGSEEGSDVR